MVSSADTDFLPFGQANLHKKCMLGKTAPEVEVRAGLGVTVDDMVSFMARHCGMADAEMTRMEERTIVE